MLKAKKVDLVIASRLIRYCEDHGREHDESFLPGRDFDLSPDYPSYLLWRDGEVAGAVVLMRTPRYRSVRKGRFSVFHSILNSREAYAALVEAIRPHFHGLRSVYLFLPEKKRNARAILESLHFVVERFSFVLESREPVVAGVEFPDGYEVHPLEPSDREGIRQFADCVNRSFREIAGHTDASPEDIRAWFDEEGHLQNGICLLKWNGKPVGTVNIIREQENHEAAEITALGILREHRGRGLGRILLRHARSVALINGLHPVILSVNAENESALKLYRSEGFIPTETMVCYALDCRRRSGKTNRQPKQRPEG